MGKFFFISILWCCFGLHTIAQSFEGGLSAGLNASQIDGDSRAGYTKLGLTGGIWVRRAFKSNFGAQLELRYQDKGAQDKSTPDNPGTYKVITRYLEVPFLIDYTFYNKRLRAELGLGANFLIASKYDPDGNGYMKPDPSYDDLSAVGILGLNWLLSERWLANVRFSYSLSPERSFPSGQTYAFNAGEYHKMLSFCLFYKIN